MFHKIRQVLVVHGYSLGLSIAKQLLEQQNGATTAASTPGKGSAFTIKPQKA
jgi:signal transduction histidine kinase